MTRIQHSQNTSSTQERYALRVTSRLSGGAQALPYDIAERLRAAREQALDQRRQVLAHTARKLQTAAVVNGSGGAATLTLGSGDYQPGWMHRIASALPVIALLAGLIAINWVQNELRADEVAEVDAAILTDDLPPAAYTDPGFAQFLKMGRTSVDEQASPAQQQ